MTRRPIPQPADPKSESARADVARSPSDKPAEGTISVRSPRESPRVCHACAPLGVDLFCGLGGWTEGLLAENYDVVGFDIEQHVYGEHRYPAQLVIQDVLTLHGSQFKDAALIVASPPCQEYSYMAMPWTRAKQIAREYRDGTRDRAKLTALFDACFRIQREACEASGRFIPLVVENVCGAQKWVGRARWHFGSYYLWGDVPALMPVVLRSDRKVGGMKWFPPDDPRHVKGQGFNTIADRHGRELERATKNAGGSWFAVAHNGTSGTSNNARDMLVGEIKQGGDWFREPGISAHGSRSTARKAASARIAKIPLALARWIAHVYRPMAVEEAVSHG